MAEEDHSNTEWRHVDVDTLASELKSKTPVERIAKLLGRSEAAVRAKIRELAERTADGKNDGGKGGAFLD